MSEKMLLTDKAREWIGYRYPEREVQVSEHDVMRFIHATRGADTSPADPILEAPLMFYAVLRTMPFQLARVADLQADGTLADELPPLQFSRGIAGETEIEFGRRIRVGDKVTIRKQIVDLAEKTGRSGVFVIVTYITEFLSASGELLAREKFARILR